jgi:Family of unknown function (DUF6600)
MATRFWRRTALYVGLTFGVLFSPVVNCSSVTQAQTSVSVEFRAALEPHGQWTTHERWGEVWIPANVGQDWEPYKIGHWVYTEEWGWYWISDETFGLVVYHYGRWIRDRDRWVWIPGQEWGPGWVSWRRGGSSGATASDRSGRPAKSRTSTALYVGWSPMPPDDVVVEYWEQPEIWIFVRAKDFTAPNVARVVLPPRERVVVIKETVVENRTVVIRERGFAVNPGIPPTFVAAAVGRPIRAVEVRPAVLAGTVQIQGAREVRPDELRRTDTRENRLVTVRETQTVIRPADRTPPPQALNPGEQGRLGDNPPRAARATPGQPAGTPTTTQDQRPQPGAPATTQDQRQQPGAPATTQDQRQQPGAPATTQDLRQQPGAPTTTQDPRRQQGVPATTQDLRQQPGAPTTTQDGRQRRGAPATTQDQRQRPDRPDAAQDERQRSPTTTQDQRLERDRSDSAQDQRQRPPSGAAEDQRGRRDRPDAAQDQRRRSPAGAAQEQRQRPEGRESADDQRQQRGRDAGRERQPGSTEGRSPPPNQRPDAQPAARPDRPEGQRSEQRGEQRGQQGPGQQQRPAAGQRPGRGQQDQGEKKEDKKDDKKDER